MFITSRALCLICNCHDHGFNRFINVNMCIIMSCLAGSVGSTGSTVINISIGFLLLFLRVILFCVLAVGVVLFTRVFHHYNIMFDFVSTFILFGWLSIRFGFALVLFSNPLSTIPEAHFLEQLPCVGFLGFLDCFCVGLFRNKFQHSTISEPLVCGSMSSFV